MDLPERGRLQTVVTVWHQRAGGRRPGARLAAIEWPLGTGVWV